MNHTEFTALWYPEIIDRGFTLTGYNEYQKYGTFAGKGVKLFLGGPDCTYPVVNNAILADNYRSFDKIWKCPVRFRLARKPSSMNWDKVLFELSRLANNEYLAAISLGKDGYFQYED